MKLPQDPPPGLLESIATRFDHSFGLMPEDSPTRRELINDARRAYEECSGHGFFKWPPKTRSSAVETQAAATLPDSRRGVQTPPQTLGEN